MEERVRLDENGHPKARKTRAKKEDVEKLKAEVMALTTANQKLLNDIGELTAEFMNLVAYKNKLESGAVRLEPTPMSVFVMFATILSKACGISGEEMRKALESL